MQLAGEWGSGEGLIQRRNAEWTVRKMLVILSGAKNLFFSVF